MRPARPCARAPGDPSLAETLRRLHGGLQEPGDFSADAEAAGRRALRNAVLDTLVAEPNARNVERAGGPFRQPRRQYDGLDGRP